MHRIVSTITSLKQHFQAVEQNSDVYRPLKCPRCGFAAMWRHGFYYRKADREGGSGDTYNPIPIFRYSCGDCRRTCSRLPLCIAPRRWYNWAVQQAVLLHLLCGWSLHQCSWWTCLDRRTVRRWRDWLHVRHNEFTFFLRSRFPEWGRSVDAHAFWLKAIADMSLWNVMAWLDRDLVIP